MPRFDTEKVEPVYSSGVSFRARGHVSAGGELGVFDALYSGRGALLGWLNVASNGTVNGTARWFRPADSRSRTYPNGFALETPMGGIAESVQAKRGKRFGFIQNDALCGPDSLEKSPASPSR